MTTKTEKPVIPAKPRHSIVVIGSTAYYRNAAGDLEMAGEIGCVSVPVSDSEPVTPERSVEDNTLKSPLSSAPGSVEEAKRYAAIGRGFSGATNSLEEALTWVRNNKNGSVYERLAALQAPSPSTIEPMNLRIFHNDKGRWFLRDGRVGGSGDTPEAAMRDYVLMRNTVAEHPAERLPVASSPSPTDRTP